MYQLGKAQIERVAQNLELKVDVAEEALSILQSLMICKPEEFDWMEDGDWTEQQEELAENWSFHQSLETLIRLELSSHEATCLFDKLPQGFVTTAFKERSPRYLESSMQTYRTLDDQICEVLGVPSSELTWDIAETMTFLFAEAGNLMFFVGGEYARRKVG